MKIKLTILILLIAISFSFSKETSAKRSIGDTIPAFQAMDDNGNLWKSQEHTGDKALVVYFYPAAMTGGCTKQACAFRDHKAELEEAGASVVGISGDDVKNLEYFKDANNLNFTLLSDSEGKIAETFGVPTRDGGSIEREIDGKKVTLKRNVTTSRWTFILDKNNKLVYKNTEVNAAMDSEQVLEFIKNM